MAPRIDALGQASPRLRRTGSGEAAAAVALDVVSAAPPDPTAAAFFDVDNTVMRGASIFHLARGLHRRKKVSTPDIVSAALNHAYFRIVGVENPDAVAKARASALSFIAGHRVDEVESLAREIFDESMASRIWPGTRALAQMHLDQGQRVWLVTAAPIEIAAIIAHRLRLTGALGTVAEHVDGATQAPWWATCCMVAPRQRPCGRWPSSRDSISSDVRPTPTPSTTFRCCPWWDVPARSTPTPSWATTPAVRVGGFVTTGRVEGWPGSGWSSRPVQELSPAPWRQPSHSGARWRGRPRSAHAVTAERRFDRRWDAAYDHGHVATAAGRLNW